MQGCVEQALSRVADSPVAVVCAGRTDTGVHATGQVIHFDTDAVRYSHNWLRGSNANLPADISVNRYTVTDETFHARFCALRRHYRYIIYNHPAHSAILRNQACWQGRQLQEARMQQAANFLLGEHDFTSFRAVACQAHSPVRNIYRLKVTRSGAFIYIDIVANAFLHHMVRCIAGVLMQAGSGDEPPEWVAAVLAARDRTLSGVNAPAAGLYLVNVSYPEKYKVPSDSRLPVLG